MSFWTSIFGGQNKTLNSDIGQFGNIGNFDVGTGQGNVTAGSSFLRDIVSGDPTRTSQALAPQISAVTNQVAQQKKTNAEFGNRSGGTTASNLSAGDKARGAISSLVGGLMGGAANSLVSSGTQLLSQGASAFGNQADASQLQMENWSNSILGLGVTKAAGWLTGAALGKA